MKRSIVVAVAAGVLMFGMFGTAPAQEGGDSQGQALIEIAILLDTSGSMEGLINQARTHLWSIVNELALARKEGQLPDLRVALYEYGKQTQPVQNGYICQLVPLTDDLDRISEELFALTTNGGDEYCGMVIQKAAEELSWTPGDHFRAIFIAGNEPFTQGPVAHRVACKAAIEKGIVVNTIHCGSEAQGRQGLWHEGADLADGRFFNIDQNQEAVAIQAPQDARIAELGKLINGTYVPYGKLGQERKKRQEAQDSEAEEAAGGAAEQRALTKGGRLYRSSSWDLVDALEEKLVDLATLKDDELPEELKELSLEERKEYIAERAKERKRIRAELQRLAEERRQFVAGERQRLAEEGADTFESAVQESLRQQLERAGFETGE